MQVPRLEHLAQIQIAVRLWNSHPVASLFRMLQESWWDDDRDILFENNQNTLLDTVRAMTYKLPLTALQKVELLDVVERVGEEFINYTYTLPVFGTDLVLSQDIIWTMYGTVNEIETLEHCVTHKKIPDKDELKRVFEYACVCCAEDLIKVLWLTLLPKDQNDLVKRLCSYNCSPVCLFWLYKLLDSSPSPDASVQSILVVSRIRNRSSYDETLSLNANMFWIAAADCSKSAASYFYKKLNAEERYIKTEYHNNGWRNSLLLYLASNLNSKAFEYAYSFLLRPCPSNSVEILVQHLNLETYYQLFNFVLYRVEYFPSFCKLHCRILESLIFFAPKRLNENLLIDHTRMREVITVIMYYSDNPLRKIRMILHDEASRLVAFQCLLSSGVHLRKLTQRFLLEHSLEELKDIFKVVAADSKELFNLILPLLESDGALCWKDKRLQNKAAELFEWAKSLKDEFDLRAGTKALRIRLM